MAQVDALIECDHTGVYFVYIYIVHVENTVKDLPYTAVQKMRGNIIEMNREQSPKSDRILAVSEYCECDGRYCVYSQDPEQAHYREPGV